MDDLIPPKPYSLCNPCKEAEFLYITSFEQFLRHLPKGWSSRRTLLEFFRLPLQTSLAEGQSHKMLKHVSSPRPHIGHKALVVAFLLQRFALVRRISWHALHRKFFSALRIGSFHKEPHISFCSTLEELSACICNSLFLASWYALLTVKKPLVVPLHTSTSPRFVLMGIDRIALTSAGKNRFSSKALFHPYESLSMSSTTFASLS